MCFCASDCFITIRFTVKGGYLRFSKVNIWDRSHMVSIFFIGEYLGVSRSNFFIFGSKRRYPTRQ